RDKFEVTAARIAEERYALELVLALEPRPLPVHPLGIDLRSAVGVDDVEPDFDDRWNREIELRFSRSRRVDQGAMLDALHGHVVVARAHEAGVPVQVPLVAAV